MPITEKQLDALSKQHQEALQSYGKKISALQQQEIKLNENIKNLNQVILDHVQIKQKELDDKIAITEKLKLDAITMKKEAQDLLYAATAKIKDADKIYEEILQEYQAHEDKVKTHIDTVSSAHADIDKRHGECAIRENKASEMMTEANKRIETALLTEKMAQEKVNEIISADEALKLDIEIQKDLYFRNKQTLDAISIIRTEVNTIKVKSESDKAEAIKIRDSLDAAQARIERNSQEIIKRNEELQAREIQIKVTEQSLKDRKSYLDGQEGRLNELRNNVNTLLEKQQATMPKEGA